MEEGRLSCFVALRVPGHTGCHITITMAKDVNAGRVEEMRLAWEAAKAMIGREPVYVLLGNYCKMGSDATIPAYKCELESPAITKWLDSYHRQFYRPKPGKPLYPKMKLHVTIDTEERREEVENIMRGPAKGLFAISDYIFEVRDRVEDEANAVFDARTWTCIRCGNRNARSAMTCIGANGCAQWRPKKARPEFGMGSGMGSGVPPVPGGRQLVVPEYAPSAPALYDAVQIPPPTQPVQQVAQQVRKAFYNDWRCPGCGDPKQFGSRASCRQCGHARPESARK